MIICFALVPLLVAVAAFAAGVKFALHFKQEEQANIRHALAHQYQRLVARVDADDPAQPYTPRHVSEQFEESFKTNGRAIEWLQRKEG